MAPITAPVPGDAFYDNFFGRIAMAIDPYEEAHSAGVMLALISYGSGALGLGPTITTIKGSLPLHIWSILSGESGGGGKGDATGAAKAIFDKALKGWSAAHQKEGFDTGLGLVKEMDGRRDDEGNPLSLLIFEPEVSSIIRAMNTDGRMMTMFTKAFDNDTLRYSSGTGSAEVRDPYVIIHGHVQPDLFVLTKKSKATAIGVWNRFLFCHVGQSKTLDMFESMPEKNRMIAALAAEFHDAWASARRRGDVRVPKSVSKAFAAHHRPRVEALVKQSKEVKQYAQRGLAYLLKLAALYAVYDGRDYVSVQDFDSALALIEYSVASVKYTLAVGAVSTGRTTLAEKVLSVVEEHKELTYSKLKSLCGGHNSKAVYMAAFRELGEEVVVYEKQMKGRGYRGGWMIAAKGHPIPEGSTLVDLRDPDGADPGADDPSDHRNFQMPEDGTEEDEIIVEATIVREEPEPDPGPRKALPAPKPAKTAPRQSQATTEPPKPKHSPHARRPAPHKKVEPAPTTPPSTAGTSWF